MNFKNLVFVAGLISLNAFAYTGPKHPNIPADAEAISIKYEDCLKDVKEVVA